MSETPSVAALERELTKYKARAARLGKKIDNLRAERHERALHRTRAERLQKTIAALRAERKKLAAELRTVSERYYQAGSADAMTRIYCALADLGDDPLDAAQWLSAKLAVFRRQKPDYQLPAKVDALIRAEVAAHVAAWQAAMARKV